MSDLTQLDEALARVTNFRRDLADKGIHVGVGIGGGRVTCPVDGEEWPCSHERAQSEGSVSS